MKSIVSVLVFLSLFLPSLVYAQESTQQDVNSVVRTRVKEVITQREEAVAGTDTSHIVQTLQAEILSGEETGKIVQIENDYLVLKENDTFYTLKYTDPGTENVTYSVYEADRNTPLLVLLLLFVTSVFLLGGKQGVRGLLSLIGSLLLIVYVLLPMILQGYPPLISAIGISSLIVVFGSYITHGFSKMTTSAVISMILTLIVTGILASLSVTATELSGVYEESAVYLHFNTSGEIDLRGLLLGGTMIGLIGVLYDIAIGQAVTVEELCRANSTLSRKEIYKRARRVGREHIGALINTLAIAYVGTALPLLLLFTAAPEGTAILNLNREIFATEIVRTLVGSIGLMLAVPITTAIAAFLLHQRNERIS